ncbi:DUF2852 domain-containing protein [Hasllibacter sp. MH4015]|uniref:DUF2852 domain-containing protein n=1 Tax=Hasllibacter sp. MH4015 TaxID=2854029 RepID=UPI001CD49032|nr:DUF2852 domain-containing protein [Hasllibacter sp. MH4015]
MAEPAPSPAAPVAPAVQVISILLYAGFAISVSIVTMAMFGMIGIALAALFAWQWGRIPVLSGRFALEDGIAALRPDVAEMAEQPASGNSSFDAYRATLLHRLEQEQGQFEGFLDRLRDAKDKREFDTFMDDRARRVRLSAEAIDA